MNPKSEEVLRRSSLIRFVLEEHYARVRDLFDEVRFDFGEYLIRQGEPADAFYVLVAGRARVLREVPGAEEIPLNRLVPGDEFGEGALLDGGLRSASVRASSTVEALRLGRADFLRLVEAYPSIREGDEPFAQGGLFGRRAPLRGTFPFVAQIDQMDCGVASLAMVCRHFGRKVGLARLRTLCHTANDGTSLSALCAAATELGLAARSVKASARHLDDLPLPAICHWEGNHWIVLYAVGTDSVRVADPATGRRRLPRTEFLQKWTGYAALFDYTEAFEKAPEDAPSLAWLRPLLTGHGGSWALVGGLALMVSVLGLLVPVLTQFVVDKVIVDGDVALLVLVLGALGVTAVLMLAANLIQQYLLSHLAVRIDSAVLDFLTRRLLSLPMSYFHSRRTGDIQRRLDGARQVRLFLVQNGVGGSLATLQAAGCIALMAVYSLKLAGVFLLVLPAYGALMWFSRRVLRPLFSDIEEAHGRYASHQIDAIKDIEAVKAAGAEGGFRDAMLSKFLEVSRQQFRGNFVGMAHESALQAISVVATLLFLWAGAHEVSGGRMTVGAFVAFSSLMAMATAAITRVLGVWDDLQVVTVLLDRLNDLLGQEPEQGADRSRLRPVPTLEGHLSLNRVGFRYGGAESPAILQDIRIEIPAGRVCAIVGRSGCGKTTLVKLVAGLLEPTEGTILFDRMDAKGLNHRDLRKRIGFVLQETTCSTTRSCGTSPSGIRSRTSTACCRRRNGPAPVPWHGSFFPKPEFHACPPARTSACSSPPFPTSVTGPWRRRSASSVPLPCPAQAIRDSSAWPT